MARLRIETRQPATDVGTVRRRGPNALLYDDVPESWLGQLVNHEPGDLTRSQLERIDGWERRHAEAGYAFAGIAGPEAGIRPGVRHGIAELRVRVSLINEQVLEQDRRHGMWSVPACDELPSEYVLLLEAEGIVRLPATWTERIRDPGADVDEIAVDVPVAGPDEMPTLHAEDYPAIATRTPADDIDRDDRWGARACDLALTLLLIAGWEIVDLLPGCDRHGWFDECYGPTELWLATKRPHSERVAPALRAAFARRVSPTTVPHVKMGVRTPF